MICNHYAKYRPKQKNIENIKKGECKVIGRVKITKYKKIFSKVTLKNGQQKYLLPIPL